MVAAVFPRRKALDNTERMALSFGLSIAMVPFIGLILNYTLWGVGLYAMLVSITVFIVVASIVAWYRRRRLADAERATVSFNFSLAPWMGQSSLDKVLSIILVAAILAAIGTLSYVVAAPKVGEKFTEFYLLGLDGQAVDYPRELKVGEEGKVLVGVINREHEIASYWLEVRLDGVRNNSVGPLTLKHDEKWEEAISFTPSKAGDNQKVEYLLYKNGQGEPYLRLHLWVDVNVKEEG